MEKYLSLAWEYRHVILGFIGAGLWVYKDSQENFIKLKAFAVSCMLYIEKKSKEELEKIPGSEKMEWVVQHVLAFVDKKMPIWLKPLMTEDNIRWFLQWVFDNAIDLWDNGKIDGSFPTR